MNIKSKYKLWVDERPERKQLYKALASLVIPIAVQNLLASLVGSLDVLMLNYVGQDEMAAVSLANQYVFIIFGFFFGINSATALMNSQYWGKGDMKAVQAVLGIAVKLSLIVTIIIAGFSTLMPEKLMYLYTNDADMIAIGAKYLKIVGVSYILMSFSQSYTCTLRSVGKATKSTVISTIALIMNAILNAVFIFGLFGAPKLGVIGVAIATTISRIIELLVCLIDYIKGSCFKPDIKLLFGRHAVLFKDFVKYAGPALFNDLAWTLAFSSYSIILGHLNNDMVAASSVAATLRDIFTTVCFGIGSGGTVLLGKELGSGDLFKAKKDASTLCMVTLVFSVILGIVLVLIRHPMMSFFTLNGRAYDYLDKMLIINGYYIVGQAINTLLIAGVFRAGGNTKFGMICDLIVMWCISVPIGFLTAFVFKAPPMVVYFVLCLDEFYKIPVVIKYYKSYKWLNNITRDDVV